MENNHVDLEFELGAKSSFKMEDGIHKSNMNTIGASHVESSNGEMDKINVMNSETNFSDL